jgi:ribosomal protein S18 acetylase RimI-like enzyme
MIRHATLNDLDALVRIEDRCFETDRLSRRNFRYLLKKGHAETLVEEEKGVVRGYTMLLFNDGISMARLYSLAVDPQFQRMGVAARLVEASEVSARQHDCVSLRLEIRKDNSASIGLFKRLGYREFGVHADYYEDHMDAVRFEKSMVKDLKPAMVRVPYYEQTLEFTCGPASVMMAMKALDQNLPLDRMLELRIWRESTTVFMTSGHGGCGPYGLALSAFHRGFDVEIYVSAEGALFINSVRDPEKKIVMRLVQEDFLNELRSVPVKIHYGVMSVKALQEQFEQGGIPIVLISSYRIYHEKSPHWVVVTGFDDRFIYVHDPLVDKDMGKTITDCVNMPILRKDFERMARYGKAAQKAVLILKKRAQAHEKPVNEEVSQARVMTRKSARWGGR